MQDILFKLICEGTSYYDTSFVWNIYFYPDWVETIIRGIAIKKRTLPDEFYVHYVNEWKDTERQYDDEQVIIFDINNIKYQFQKDVIVEFLDEVLTAMESCEHYTFTMTKEERNA